MPAADVWFHAKVAKLNYDKTPRAPRRCIFICCTPLLFESSYYVAPEEKISRPYALFLAALTETKRDAIAKVAIHNREHVVLIRAAEGGLVLHTLYYQDELHKANKAESPKTKFPAKALDMAKSVVQHWFE